MCNVAFQLTLGTYISASVSGGGDTGDDRQDPGKCGGSEEETQCHSLGPTDR